MVHGRINTEKRRGKDAYEKSFQYGHKLWVYTGGISLNTQIYWKNRLKILFFNRFLLSYCKKILKTQNFTILCDSERKIRLKYPILVLKYSYRLHFKYLSTGDCL